VDPAVFVVIVAIVVIVTALATRPAPPARGTDDLPVQGTAGQTITRTYKGNPQEAAAAAQQDAAELAARGYYPTGQSYSPGSWGCGAFLVALLLAIVLIGILIFIYLIIVKPAGTLVVTYEYRDRAPVAAAPASPAVIPDPATALASLADMRDRGLITAEEYEAKKTELLKRM